MTINRLQWTEGFSGLQRYARKWRLWLFMMGVGILCSALIPPLQAPDEADHVTRTALLMDGSWLLQSPPGQSSGGFIDAGLADYISAYQTLWGPRNPKLTQALKDSAEAIRWSGETEFRSAPGTGYYFPAIYIPEALGLKFGQLLGFTVDLSYRTARLFSIICISTILIISFEIIEPSIFIIALLILPIALFQFGSSTIDAISFAVTILVTSIALVIAREKRFNGVMIVSMTIGIILVVTSRVNMFPLLFINLFLYFITKNWKLLLAFLLSMSSSLLWVFLALRNTVDLRVAMPAPPTEMAFRYLVHPGDLGRILFSTLSYAPLKEYYRQSFIGVLGNTDTFLRENMYVLFTYLLLIIFMLSISLPKNRERYFIAVCFIIIAILSILSAFFLLLVTWTPGQSDVIVGIHGRYFILPAIIIGYAVHDESDKNKHLFYKKLALILLIFMGLVLLAYFPRVIMERYGLE